LQLTSVLFFFFFFQAEDGIRDDLVTGVQTCALPISSSPPQNTGLPFITNGYGVARAVIPCFGAVRKLLPTCRSSGCCTPTCGNRSEERRVGKEGRSRWSPDH